MNAWTRERDPVEPLLLTPAQAARMLAVSARTLWGLRDLPRVKIGRSVRYAVEDIKKFIESRKSA